VSRQPRPPENNYVEIDIDQLLLKIQELELRIIALEKKCGPKKSEKG